MPKRGVGLDPWEEARREKVAEGAGVQTKKKAQRKKGKAAAYPDKKNYYKKKDGTVMYKLTLPLPPELVQRLKIKAIQENMSLSAYIREKLELKIEK